MLYGGNSRTLTSEFKFAIAVRFKVTHQGPVAWLLGMEITRNRELRSIKVSQGKYIMDILKRFNMESCNPVTIPMAPGDRLTAAEKTEAELAAMENRPYQSLVGSLLYATVCSRPDIAFAVISLTRFMSAPSESHWEAAKRVLRYLRGTQDKGLIYGEINNFLGYCDADWAGDTVSRRSTTGYCFIVNGAAISWSSKLQVTVALSSAEAEYMAAAAAVQEVVYLRRLIKVIKVVNDLPPTLLLEDNQGCLALIKNPVFQPRTKHIDTKFHFIRQRVEDGEAIVEYCPTKDMIADIFTKPLERVSFTRFRDGVMGRGSTQ